MVRWLPKVLLSSGVALALWAIGFPLHSAALQRARCMAYEQELRHVEAGTLVATGTSKYADAFAAAARVMSGLSTTTLVTAVALVITGSACVWASRTKGR